MNNTYRAQVVTPAEREAARLRLLAKEQELTPARDALAAQRTRMPWLQVDQEYAFDGPNGAARLPPTPRSRSPHAQAIQPPVTTEVGGSCTP